MQPVTRFSLAPLSLRLRLELSRAAFVSLDTEFSGLGGAATRAADLAARYAALRATATACALLCLGVAAFRETGAAAAAAAARAFDFALRPSAPFEVAPASAAFLVDHAFDWNRTFREGIDPAQLKDLFAYIVQLNVPIVIHNGLLDLMFIYQTFYTELPPDLDTFVADLHDLFPAGIVDTKYIADYVSHEKASYLAYLYRKYERNILKSQTTSIQLLPPIEFSSPITIPQSALLPNGEISATLSLKSDNSAGTTVTKKKRSKQQERDDRKVYCVQYASHGYCASGPACAKSHDLDIILDEEEAESLQNAGKKKAKGESTNAISKAAVNSTPDVTNPPSPKVVVKQIAAIPGLNASEPAIPAITPALLQTYHSASFDAYMTGYVFFAQLQALQPVAPNSPPITLKEQLTAFVKLHGNKLYLIGKNIPLSIIKSSFSKTSIGHARMKLAWKDQAASAS
ncbi:ribonuclease CAF1 [Obelidium mucronatum]|nr:ribonuclease CAF1 [Obelidium mucronatum]